MKLQTSIPLKKHNGNLVDYQSKVLLLGSCFVENISRKLAYFKFQSHQNPVGILFHPKAIETLIVRAVQGKAYNEEDVFFNNGQWHCFEVHSQMSKLDKQVLIAYLNEQLQATRQHIIEASHIVITLGTAWVYTHGQSNLPVANCHKMPQSNFKKVLLSINDITQTLQNIQDQIKVLNASVDIVFTVSPVRHIKDGFVENTRSKAHLIAAIHEFISQPNAEGCLYFPSYDIMMDELRDYRFYAEDMLHPNMTAINYIWEKFQQVWLADHTLVTMAEVDAIQKGLLHKPFNSQSDAHIAFLEQLEQRKNTLQAMFNHIIF